MSFRPANAANGVFKDLASGYEMACLPAEGAVGSAMTSFIYQFRAVFNPMRRVFAVVTASARTCVCSINCNCLRVSKKGVHCDIISRIFEGKVAPLKRELVVVFKGTVTVHVSVVERRNCCGCRSCATSLFGAFFCLLFVERREFR